MMTILCFSTLTLAQQPAKVLPSADFLEYLAELQKIDGEWLDASDVADDKDLKNATVVSKQSPTKAALAQTDKPQALKQATQPQTNKTKEVQPL